MGLKRKLMKTKEVNAYNAKKLTALIVVLAAFFAGGWSAIKTEALRMEVFIRSFNEAVADEQITDKERADIIEKARQLAIFRWWSRG